MANHVAHGSTKGDIRETYLKEVIGDFLPETFFVGSGFLCDLKNDLSPQLDLVIADRRFIPPVTLYDDVAYFPVESALAHMEVKSTLKKDDFKQIKRQHESISKLNVANVPEFGVVHDSKTSF